MDVTGGIIHYLLKIVDQSKRVCMRIIYIYIYIYIYIISDIRVVLANCI